MQRQSLNSKIITNKEENEGGTGKDFRSKHLSLCESHEDVPCILPTIGSVTDQGPHCCTVKPTVTFALRPHFPWAAPSQSPSMARILSDAYSWETLDSSDS